MEQERGVESGECYFKRTLLDELTKHLCGEMKNFTDPVWNQTANKLVEEAYENFERIESNGDGEKFTYEVAATKPGLVHALHNFIVAVFTALPQGLTHDVANAWLFSHGFLLGLTKHHPIAKLVVENGLLPHIIDELQRLRLTEVNWATKSILISDLVILYNCVYNVSINGYFHTYSFLDILGPYLRASDRTMNLHAKMIMAYISSTLQEEEVQELLCLTPTTANNLIATFGEASTSVNRKSGGFTVTELAHTFTRLLVCQKNIELIAKSDILPAIVTALSCGDVQEQQATCQLLWLILKQSGFKSIATEGEFPLPECLEQLQQSDDDSLQLLAFCVLFELDCTSTEDLPLMMKYIKGCYKYEHFTNCIKMCEKYLHKFTSSIECGDAHLLKLYKGKSLFCMYRRQAFQIELLEKKGIKSGKKYQLMHKQCFDIAGECIGLLISAIDGEFIDDEGLKMLDLAMIDFSKETNKLNDFNRCLLCQKNAKLHRSHIFPRSILEKFGKGMSRPEKTKQNITPMRPGPLQSPRSAMTTFLFCDACEHLFSRNGEMQFSPMFLDVLYNIKSSNSLASEHHISYEKWLYQFCIGLMFRFLAQFYPHDFCNDNDIYKFFTLCRKYLLSSDNIAKDDLPDIAIFVNPVSVVPKEAKVGFMDHALNYPLILSSSSLPLDGIDQKTPDKIFYFIVHFGIINVIGIVNSAQKEGLPAECFIHEAGGVLHVPDNQERYNAMPRGLWKYFKHQAVEIEAEYLQMSLSRLNWQEDNVLTEPPEELVNLFSFIPSYDRDIEDQAQKLRPATVAGAEKTLNFLPKGFQLYHYEEKRSVFIPDNHKLIFHSNTRNASKLSHTLFLAVGNEGIFSFNRPYIICHIYQHGLQLHSAFFINPNTLQAEDFLPDSDPKIRAKDIKPFSLIRENMPALLKQILLSKGVCNLKYLLRRIEMRGEVNYDLKCQSEDHCWYCKDLCHNCMKTAAIDLTANIPNSSTVMQFCSKECNIISPNLKVSPYIDFWDKTQNPPAPTSRTCALHNGHKELLYIFSECTMSTGYHLFDITLSTGSDPEPFHDGQVYVVCYCRQRSHQLFFEFFLSKDLHVQEMIVSGSKENIPEGFADSANSVLNMIIKGALDTKGIHDIHSLLKLYDK